ncbi:hypothetical protein IQ276_023485 [Desmonostoc muscorum LEGE 12446]|uniref:Lipoprotein n=1 Tax=Desmonostoc muscorum LEGE 12446 TaxID=1828758 RepID=A0A8J7D0Z7_DESMC|nr:hypothetical protein [Desmonostoc muscorum]MCF2149338.1 hypothetical protein [Desmonostoc muscorum LEGE 12446]
MKIQLLVKILALLMLVETTTACGFSSTYANNQPHSSPTLIMTNNTALVKKVTLIAREENLPPLGVPVDPQRNIGFASVFVRLENPQETPVTVTITKVEIRNLSDGKLQDFQQTPQKIELKPLENSELAFQLTNKRGYAGKDKVKAIVTYQIEDQSSIIESDAVEVTH